MTNVAHTLPTPLVRAVLDAGVELYPVNDERRVEDRQATRDAVRAYRTRQLKRVREQLAELDREALVERFGTLDALLAEAVPEQVRRVQRHRGGAS